MELRDMATGQRERSVDQVSGRIGLAAAELSEPSFILYPPRRALPGLPGRAARCAEQLGQACSLAFDTHWENFFVITTYLYLTL